MTEKQDNWASSEARDRSGRSRRLLGRLRRLAPLGFVVLGVLLTLVVYRSLDSEPETITKSEVEEAVPGALESITAAPALSAQVYQAILPSLVVVQEKSEESEREHRVGIGSGVIINSSAAILTSLHVIEEASEITVSFADSTRTSARVAERQPENDIAVLVPETLPEIFAPAIIGSSRGCESVTRCSLWATHLGWRVHSAQGLYPAWAAHSHRSTAN